MAAANDPTTLYTSTEFEECAGTIPFDLATGRICLIHKSRRDVWILPKGHRDRGETREEAALRETCEETGYRCHLPKVNMSTRIIPAGDTGYRQEKPPIYKGVSEPVAVMVRELPDKWGVRSIKFIWWYIAAIDGKVSDAEAQGHGENFESGLFGYEEALQKLTYQVDREVVGKAVEIIKATYGVN